jgi:PST family polysaccharide transporter
MISHKPEPRPEGIVANPPASGDGKAVGSHDHHFQTGHLLKNFKARTVFSGLVTALAQGAKFILSLASTIILARLLTPQDFGLIGMVLAVTSFLRVFKDAGLSAATVQREGITHAQVSNLFWVNVLLSAVMTVGVAATAPLVARFYHEPRLAGVTLALSLTFILNGSTVQHVALLNRQMRFKVLAAIEVSSLFISVVTGVVMALSGCRYWSLVGSSLSLEAAGLALTWMASSWRPQLPKGGCGTRSLIHFGANLTVGNFVYSVARGTDGLLIGRQFGPDSLGLYTRASALLLRPIDQFLSPINAVFIPSVSRLQDQPERYRSTFFRAFEMIALISFPCSGFFLAVAHPLTLVLLGRKWEGAAVIFGGFTLAALYAPLSSASTWLFTSQGRGRDAMIACIISSILTVAAFVAGLPYGPAGVALVFSGSGLLVRLPILYHIAGRSGPVKTCDLWQVFFSHLPLWGLVFGVTELTRHFILHMSSLSQLLICATVALLAAAVSIALLPRSRTAFLYLTNSLLSLKSPKLATTA